MEIDLQSHSASRPQPKKTYQRRKRAEHGEVYFLIAQFLSNGPCKKAAQALKQELVEHKLLPKRTKIDIHRNNQSNVLVSQTVPRSYEEMVKLHPDIDGNHLVRLLQQLIAHHKTLHCAKGNNTTQGITTYSLLGTRHHSLIKSVRDKSIAPSSRPQYRYANPSSTKNSLFNLALRESFGGHIFGGSNRPAAMGSCITVMNAPTHIGSRFALRDTLIGHRNAIYCAVYDRKGEFLVTGSDDRLVKIWCLKTGLCVRTCFGHRGDITDIAVSHDRKLIASTANDGIIKLWTFPAGHPVATIREHKRPVTSVAFNPGKGLEHFMITTCNDGTVRLWDTRKNPPIFRVYIPRPAEPTPRGPNPPWVGVKLPAVTCCSFSVDGMFFVTGSKDNVARIWRTREIQESMQDRPLFEEETLQGHENEVNYVQFCDVPSMVQSGYSVREENRVETTKGSAHYSLVTCSTDGTAIVWRPKLKKQKGKTYTWVKRHRLYGPSPPPKPAMKGKKYKSGAVEVNTLTWNLDNSLVLAAMMDNHICVWSALTGKLIYSLKGHTNKVFVLDVHPNHPRLAMSAGYDGKVILWDIQKGEQINSFQVSDSQLVEGRFTPDGNSFLVADDIGKIYFYSIPDVPKWKKLPKEQFYLGDYRDNVSTIDEELFDEETSLPVHIRNLHDYICDITMIPYPEPEQSRLQTARLSRIGESWLPLDAPLLMGPSDDPVGLYYPIANAEGKLMPLPPRIIFPPRRVPNVRRVRFARDGEGDEEDRDDGDQMDGSDYQASENDDSDDHAVDLSEDEEEEDEDDSEDFEPRRGRTRALSSRQSRERRVTRRRSRRNSRSDGANRGEEVEERRRAEQISARSQRASRRRKREEREEQEEREEEEEEAKQEMEMDGDSESSELEETEEEQDFDDSEKIEDELEVAEEGAEREEDVVEEDEYEEKDMEEKLEEEDDEDEPPHWPVTSTRQRRGRTQRSRRAIESEEDEESAQVEESEKSEEKEDKEEVDENEEESDEEMRVFQNLVKASQRRRRRSTEVETQQEEESGRVLRAKRRKSPLLAVEDSESSPSLRDFATDEERSYGRRQVRKQGPPKRQQRNRSTVNKELKPRSRPQRHAAQVAMDQLRYQQEVIENLDFDGDPRGNSRKKTSKNVEAGHADGDGEAANLRRSTRLHGTRN